MLPTLTSAVIGRVLLRCRLTLHNVPAAQYARGVRSRIQEIANSSDVEYDPEDPESYKMTAMYEDLEDFEKFQEVEDSSRDKRNLRRKIALKTIQHKFFRPSQEVNLLTWDAKEQIRYLHQEFPDEWTVEKLSESFPISIEGVQLLLKSKFQPQTIEYVVKHDQSVHRAWKKLKAAEKGTLAEGPIVNRYKLLIENNQLRLLGNASGNALLPNSDWQRQLLNRKDVKDEKPGRYESIVAEYLKLKALKDQLMASMSLNKEQENILADHLLSNKMYLEGITKKPVAAEKSRRHNKESWRKEDDMESVVTELSDLTKIDKHLPRTNSQEDLSEGHQEDIRNIRSNGRVPNRNLETKSTFNFCDGNLNVVESTDEKYSDSISPASSKSASSYPLTMQDQICMGMDGTAKLQSKDTTKLQSRFEHKNNTREDYMAEEEIQKLQDENISWHATRKSKTWKKSDVAEEYLCYEKAVNVEDAEAYIYDPDKGYQYPYGQRKHLPRERVNVPLNKTRSDDETVIYQRGKDVYDEDGEFLYRIS